MFYLPSSSSKCVACVVHINCDNYLLHCCRHAVFVVQPKPVRDLLVISRGVNPPMISFGSPKRSKSIHYAVSVNCGLHYSVSRMFMLPMVA